MSSGVRVDGFRRAVPEGLNRIREVAVSGPSSSRALLAAFVVVFGLQTWCLVLLAADRTPEASPWAAVAMAAGVLLLWPVGRRLGLGAVPSGGAVLLAGTATVLVGVALPVAWVAVLCLVLAGALACAPGPARFFGAPPAVLAVVVFPLVSVPLLALGAALLISSAIGTRWPARVRWRLGAVAALVAIGMLVATTGDRPLAVTASAPGWPATVVAAAVVVVVAVAATAWVRLRWLRPVAVAALALCACAAVPGTTAGALVVAIPVAALLAAALLDGPAWVGSARVIGVALAVAALLTAAALVATWPGPAPAAPVPAAPAVVDPARTAAGWVSADLDPALLVATDQATRDRLVGAGVPDWRAVPLDPAPAGPYVVLLPLGDRPDLDAARDGSTPVARWGDGLPGGMEARVPVPPGWDGERARADRAQAAAALADSRALETAPEVRDALRAGAVDPRLTALLAGLTESHAVGVGELAAGAGELPDAPRRIAVITTLDGVGTGDPAVAGTLQSLLLERAGPNPPEVWQVTGEPLRAGYRVPSPTAFPSG